MIGRSNRTALAPRAVRVRNVFLCHAAARLGLPQPTAEELKGLRDDAGLRHAVDAWRARHGATARDNEAAQGPARPRSVLRVAASAAAALLALALSAGAVH